MLSGGFTNSFIVRMMATVMIALRKRAMPKAYELGLYVEPGGHALYLWVTPSGFSGTRLSGSQEMT